MSSASPDTALELRDGVDPVRLTQTESALMRILAARVGQVRELAREEGRVQPDGAGQGGAAASGQGLSTPRGGVRVAVDGALGDELGGGGHLEDFKIQLLRDADRLSDIPGVIVHGRYDVVTPIKNAFDLSRVWPLAELRVVPDAGHAMTEPGITHALVAATRMYAGN